MRMIMIFGKISIWFLIVRINIVESKMESFWIIWKSYISANMNVSCAVIIWHRGYLIALYALFLGWKKHIIVSVLFAGGFLWVIKKQTLSWDIYEIVAFQYREQSRNVSWLIQDISTDIRGIAFLRMQSGVCRLHRLTRFMLPFSTILIWKRYCIAKWCLLKLRSRILPWKVYW